MNSLKEKAIKLRKLGKSYGEISTELSVAKSTLSYWLKTVSISKGHRQRLYTNRIKNMVRGPNSYHERRWKEVETIIANGKKEISSPLSQDARRLLGAALYWAEGSKAGAFSIANSDPILILFIVRWLTKEFDIQSRDLKAWLNIYPQQNDNDLKGFWSDLSGIPVSRFGKSYVKPLSKNYKKNNLYYGTIRIRVSKSTDLKHRVYGWLQGALEEYAPEYQATQKKWARLSDVEKPVNLD